MFEDNEETIPLVKNPKFHSRSKHINIKYHYIRKAVKNKRAQIEYYRTEEIIADLLPQNLLRTWGN